MRVNMTRESIKQQIKDLSVFTQIDTLITMLTESHTESLKLKDDIMQLESKLNAQSNELEKLAHYKNQCGHLKAKIRKWKLKGLVC